MRFASAFLCSALAASAGVYLEPNRGQAEIGAGFLARTSTGVIATGSSAIGYIGRDGSSGAIVFEGATSHARALPQQLLPGVSHYVRGRDPARWVWDVPHYAGVQYQEVYPGIDLLYRASHGDVEFDFLLAPGADPARIRMSVPAGVRIGASGALAFGRTLLRAPTAWQTIGGQRVPVAVRFALNRRHRASFQLGAYDPTLPLTIDPLVQFATFLGGSDNDVGKRVLSGSDGAIYIAGNTLSADFPASLSPDNPLNRPDALYTQTAYIARLKPDASALDWSLFIGGSGRQSVFDLKQDNFGNLYLLGSTTSPNFPVTPGAWRTSINPLMNDVFVMKFDAQTGHIGIGTFLGIEGVSAMLAIDVAGGIYVAGRRLYGGFTPTPGAFQVTTPSSYFVMRLNSAASAAVYATYWSVGSIVAMEVDGGGNLLLGGVVSGDPQPGAPPFPAVNPLPGINQTPSFPGQAYIARLNASGTALTFSSLLHGDVDGSSFADLKVAADGSFYVFGIAGGFKFPIVNPLVVDPPLPAPSSGSSEPGAFLARISADGRAILQSTVFYGPAYASTGNLRIALQPSGFPCLAGLGTPVTQQTPGGFLGFPVSGGWSLSCVDSAGVRINLRTALPLGVEYTDITATSDGGFLFTGSAASALATTPGVVQPKFGGQGLYNIYASPDDIPLGDAFLMRINLDNPSPHIRLVSPDSQVLDTATFGACSPLLTGSGFAYGAGTTLNGHAVTGSFTDAGHYTITFDCSALRPGANHIAVTLPPPGGGTSDAILTGINAPPSAISVSPSSVTQGAIETKLVVRATNLTPDSVLYWNGLPRAASYVLDGAPTRTGHFEFLLEPPELAQPYTAQITVSNPGPGGGLSRPVLFAVQPASDAGPPILFLPTPFISNEAYPLGPRISLAGAGFTASTRVFWDGAEVPVTAFASNRITIQPPSGDLTYLGAHDVYAANGTFQSLPVRVFFGRLLPPFTSALTYDPVQKRLYLLGSSATVANAAPFDLLVFDAANGNLLNSLPALVSNPYAAALSADGHYLYLSNSAVGSLTSILRYNTLTNAVDLRWDVPPAEAQTTSGVYTLATPPDSPETLIVSTFDGRVLIFDRDRQRPYDSVSAGFPTNTFNGGYSIFFASATRIYTGPGAQLPSNPCWTWLDYDAFGISGGQPTCAGEPPEVQHDSGVTYLTDGTRVYVISLPSPLLAVQFGPSLAADLTRRHAWQFGNSTSGFQLFDYSMDARQFQLQAQLGLFFSSGASRIFAANNGAVLLIQGSSVLLIP